MGYSFGSVNPDRPLDADAMNVAGTTTFYNLLIILTEIPPLPSPPSLTLLLTYAPFLLVLNPELRLECEKGVTVISLITYHFVQNITIT